MCIPLMIGRKEANPAKKHGQRNPRTSWHSHPLSSLEWAPTDVTSPKRALKPSDGLIEASVMKNKRLSEELTWCFFCCFVIIDIGKIIFHYSFLRSSRVGWRRGLVVYRIRHWAYPTWFNLSSWRWPLLLLFFWSFNRFIYWTGRLATSTAHVPPLRCV